ncbi:fungal pheromone STE3G-protein-coupled receptor [Favolaschia claudopus]|uniref:Fungal pheromone STE3G-protein-coupled receptor n=1 Tax=Favolaschia claudopus TaxID=2862362 RepID=A0AAW0CBJ5_9AGAR
MPSASQAAPFVGLVLILLTLPHHWRVKNIATLSIIAWLSAYNLIFGVNAIIWDGNFENRAPVWCDIVTKIKIGADVALPGCVLCMAKRLNRIAYGLEMSPSGWRHRMLDFLLCWGFAFLVMALHIIVQGHRFDILENIGCIPAVYTSWPSIIILDLSGLIPAILALVFCGLTLLKLYRRRVAFRIALRNTQSSLTPSRFIRLMIMTFFLGTWSTVLISVSTYNEYYETGLDPWTSWADVHFHFSYIGQYPLSEDVFPPSVIRCTYVLWAAIPLSSLSFFLFFGVGKDAMKDYRASADWIRRNIFRKRRPLSVSEEPIHSFPQFFEDTVDDGGREKSLPPTPLTPLIIVYPRVSVVDLAA